MKPESIDTTKGGLPLAATPLLADLKRSLDSAVREYESAIMRTPTDESEIRRAVDKCHSARLRFNAANASDVPCADARPLNRN